MPADTKDHVIPRARRGSVPQEWLLRVPDTVPACGECNSLASDAIVEQTVERKREEIQLRLRGRYRKLLKMPDHSPEELAALGSTLRRSVKAKLRQRDTLIERLAWPDLIGMEYLERHNDPSAPIENAPGASHAPQNRQDFRAEGSLAWIWNDQETW